MNRKIMLLLISLPHHKRMFKSVRALDSATQLHILCKVYVAHRPHQVALVALYL